MAPERLWMKGHSESPTNCV